MTNKITRRAFLKCTGAVAVAAGMAGALSGCDLVDDIINNATENYPNMTTLGGVSFEVCGLHAALVNTTYDEEGNETGGNIASFAILISLGNFTGGEGKSVSKNNFSLKVDDKETEMLLSDAAIEATDHYLGDTSYLLLDKNGNAALGGTLSEDGYPDGHIVFRFKDDVKVENWNKAVLTISLGGKSTMFTMTHTGNRNDFRNWDNYDISKK